MCVYIYIYIYIYIFRTRKRPRVAESRSVAAEFFEVECVHPRLALALFFSTIWIRGAVTGDVIIVWYDMLYYYVML